MIFKYCGTNLEVACSDFGTVYELDSKFCDECGNDLKISKEKHPIDYRKLQSYTPKFLADKILTICSSIKGERKLVDKKHKGLNYLKSAEEMFIELDMDFYLARVREVLKGLKYVIKITQLYWLSLVRLSLLFTMQN